MHDVNHWVAVGCMGGKVQLADSLRMPVSAYLAKQLRALYPQSINRKSNVLPVTLVPCSQQNNASDCGVFAAACAFEWVRGNGPQGIKWDEKAMRRHLERCLTSKQVLAFPQVQNNKRGRKEGNNTMTD